VLGWDSGINTDKLTATQKKTHINWVWCEIRELANCGEEKQNQLGPQRRTRSLRWGRGLRARRNGGKKVSKRKERTHRGGREKEEEKKEWIVTKMRQKPQLVLKTKKKRWGKELCWLLRGEKNSEGGENREEKEQTFAYPGDEAGRRGCSAKKISPEDLKNTKG